MIFFETKFKNLYVIEPELHNDNRGSFFRYFCKEEFLELGIDVEFIQFNESINFKTGTFRGLHYQKAPYEDNKFIRCVSGKVLDILVDLRKNSPTFLKYLTVVISDKNRKMLFVPKGVAHGFLTLENNSRLLYHHTAHYKPNFEAAVNYRDPKINLKLPNTVNIISSKDLDIPFLKDDFNGL